MADSMFSNKRLSPAPRSSGKKTTVFTSRNFAMDHTMYLEEDYTEGTRRKTYDRSPDPVYDAPEALDGSEDTASLAPDAYADEYHDADEPFSGTATPTMQSPMARKTCQEQQRPMRNSIHPNGRPSMGHHHRQSFEFDRGHQQHDGPSQSTSQHHHNNNNNRAGGSSRAMSDATASSPYSEHSSRRSTKKQSAFSRAMADSRRAFKYYDTPLEEHLVDDVERRRRAMLQQQRRGMGQGHPHATPTRRGPHRRSSEDFYDANEGDVQPDDTISAYYGSGGRPARGSARRRLASPPAKSTGGGTAGYNSNASSPSRNSWVLRPLAVPAQSPSGAATSTAASGGEGGGGGSRGFKGVWGWLAAVAVGAATVTVCTNPNVQAQLVRVTVHAAQGIAHAATAAGAALGHTVLGAIAGATKAATRRATAQPTPAPPSASPPRRAPPPRGVPRGALRRYLLIEEQQLTLRMLRDKAAAAAKPGLGQVLHARMASMGEASQRAAAAVATGVCDAAQAAATGTRATLDAAGRELEAKGVVVITAAGAAVRAMDVRPALQWAVSQVTRPLREERRRRQQWRMQAAARAAARRKRALGADLLHHRARNPDGLLPEQRLRVEQRPRSRRVVFG